MSMESESQRDTQHGTHINSPREVELQILQHAHQDLIDRGASQVVFVTGQSGFGKTHLINAFAKSHGGLTFAAQSVDSGVAFSLFSSILSDALKQLQRMACDELVLSKLFERTAGLRSAEQALDRTLAFDSVIEVFELLARSNPCIILDNIDRADQSSIELLKFIISVASAPGAQLRLFLVLAHTEPLNANLRESAKALGAKTISLKGLNLEGIRTFLQGSDVASRLYELTLGNPEVLTELLERPLPSADFLVKRFERLQPDAKHIIELLSVARQALPLVDLLKLSPTSTAGTLDLLSHDRLVVAVSKGDKTAFGLARAGDADVISTLMSQEEKVASAISLASMYENQKLYGAASALLEGIDHARAAELALAAGEHFKMRSAYEESAKWLLGALVRQSPVKQQAAASLTQVAMLLGRYRLATRAALMSARLSGHRSTLSIAVTALTKLGRSKWARLILAKLDNTHEAAILKAELDLAEGNLVAVDAAWLSMMNSDAEVSQKARLQQLKGKAALINGDLTEARIQFSAVARIAKGELAVAARFNEGVAAYRLGDIDHASTVWQMAAASSDSRPIQAHADANLGSLFVESGDYSAAIERLEKALATFSRFGSYREVALAASNLARFAIFLGDFERAKALVHFAHRKGSSASDSYVLASAALALGSISFETQSYEQARNHFETARNTFELLKNDAYAALSSALKARTHIARNEKAQAEIELSRSCVERGEKSMPAAMVEVEFARAELALEMQNFTGAMRSVFRVKESLLDARDVDASIMAHTLMGRIKGASGDSSAAKVEFEKAARLINETSLKIPMPYRAAFLSVHRRAQVLHWASNPVAKLLRESVVPAVSLQGLVGQSAALQKLKEKLPPVGRSNSTVLIRGESGTGKEALAEAIHLLSPRRHMPLVKVNCAAMVDELLLSELFGHEKGAFTGAIRERKGRFEAADGGSIFLDEIGDISPKAQVALLRVLQEKEYERVGGTKTLRADVRVICATNRDLETLIAQGAFRADLYYRLKGVMLELPPLRDRLDDLPVLVDHFAQKIALDRGEPAKGLSIEALALLQRHHWPGNIRELENVVMAATLFAENDTIGVEAFSQYEDLGALVRNSVEPVLITATTVQLTSPVATKMPSVTAPDVAVPTGALDYFEMARVRDMSLKDLKHEMEMQCILKALSLSDGNISEAARLLKMKRSRLSQIVNAEPQLKEVARGE